MTLTVGSLRHTALLPRQCALKDSKTSALHNRDTRVNPAGDRGSVSQAQRSLKKGCTGVLQWLGWETVCRSLGLGSGCQHPSCSQEPVHEAGYRGSGQCQPGCPSTRTGSLGEREGTRLQEGGQESPWMRGEGPWLCAMFLLHHTTTLPGRFAVAPFYRGKN